MLQKQEEDISSRREQKTVLFQQFFFDKMKNHQKNLLDFFELQSISILAFCN